jgi:cation diffusion facilitator CzcD-associated flavoprotein CzcO
MSGSYEFISIGGGLHGFYTANYLLNETHLTEDDIAVIDPDGLGEVFRRQAEQCGMDLLRSPHTYNLSSNSDNLLNYAEREDRTDELVAGDGLPIRPTTELFLDHMDEVIDRNNLENIHIEDEVTGLTLGEEVELETEKGVYEAENALIAVGKADPNYPGFAEDIDEDAPIHHVYDPDFRLDNLEDFDRRNIVVGGSLTAGQVSTNLVREGEEVTMLTRNPIGYNLMEAEGQWNNEWKIRTLEGDTLGERYSAVEQGKNQGSMPDYVWRDVVKELEKGDLDVKMDEITGTEFQGQELTVETADGRELEDVRIILATGFEEIYNNSFLQKISDETALTTGYKDMPLLEDDTIQWRTSSGQESGVHLIGEAAKGSIGPFAGLLAGAEIGAKRISDSLE